MLAVGKSIIKQFAYFNEASFVRVLKLFLIVSLLAICYAMIFCGFQIVDEFEHLHASWLVSIGKVPYRDFFEHHNPLLWYISAPIVSLFYDNLKIFYVMRVISFLISLLTLYYVYNISILISGKKGALISVALSLCNLITFYNFYQFRPDNFMNLFFMAGVYYLCLALKISMQKNLIFSFVSFALSFLFLQKIALQLVVIEGILLVLIYQKYVKLKSVFIAAGCALLGLAMFFFYLYQKGALLDYLELNLVFNQALVRGFERGAFWYSNIFVGIYGIALISAIFFFKKENVFFRMLAIIYVAEFFMRALYFAPHPNYYTLLTYLGAICIVPLIQWGGNNYKIFQIILILFLFLNLGHIFNKTDAVSEIHNSYKHYRLAQYVHQNTDATEYLMNGYDMNFNVYRKDVSYYWFGLDMLLPVMEKEYGIDVKMDINALILQYRPKFVYTENYVDLLSYRLYGEKKFIQVLSPKILSRLYEETPFANLVILK